jgi:hypothetical protein
VAAGLFSIALLLIRRLGAGTRRGSGLYLKDRRAVPPNPLALDPDLVERVWRATERLT